tara:strand:+ start:1050 stop:2420 length:1371 start_codon:yes stop_codon:yes gene_type:complete
VNRTIYNLAFYLLLPLIVLRLLWRALFLPAPAYARRWGERLGFVADVAESRRRQFGETQWIWVHAASVGESVAIAPLVHKIRSELPGWGVVVTTMTPTGSERVFEMFGDNVCHVYAPYDYRGAVTRFLKAFHPALVILVETELWPNLVHYSKQSGARLLVANARLSEKSFRGYEKFSALGKPMLQKIDLIAAQGASDAERFKGLGVSEEQLEITGSIKFDITLPSDLQQRVANFRQRIEGNRPIWIAASTREGEDEKVLLAHKQVREHFPDALLILVPRHPERFSSAEKLFQSSQMNVVRRSSSQAVSRDVDVFLGDSMGELLLYYSLADIAFVGGSLVDTGCQNVLEPAALAKPVLVGPSQYNFQVICERLESCGALVTVDTAEVLGKKLITLFQDEAVRQQMGDAGKQAIADNRGALSRLFRLVENFLPGSDEESGDEEKGDVKKGSGSHVRSK